MSWTPPTATGFPAPGITCTPASGSPFPVGATLVTCTATNLAGPNSCIFLVTVCAKNIAAANAIDSAWAGGPFADGGSFVVGVSVEVRITAFERRSASEFWLGFTGAAGASYRVEWSENLTTWNELGAATEAAPGVFEYLNTSATPNHRFYRATKP